MVKFNNATRAQIAQVQGITILKKVADIIQYHYDSDKEMNKLQRMFDIVNEKDSE